MTDEWTTDDMPHICQSYIDRAEKAEALVKELLLDKHRLSIALALHAGIVLEAGDCGVSTPENMEAGEGTPPGGNQ